MNSRTSVRRDTRAFSLIEVTLSLAIVGFALLTMMAMMPVGLKMFADSAQQESLSNIINQIRGQLQQMPFTTAASSKESGVTGVDTTTILTLNSGGTKYYDTAGNTAIVGPTAVKYYGVTLSVPVAGTPYEVNADQTGISTNNAIPVTVVIAYPYPATTPIAQQKFITNVIFVAKQVGS